MSVIGPRPGLWNQDVLTAERDKYGARGHSSIGMISFLCTLPVYNHNNSHDW